MSLTQLRQSLRLEAIRGAVGAHSPVRRDKVKAGFLPGSDADQAFQQRTWEAVAKNFLGTVAGFKVWLVDGPQIRASIDPDFTSGGNGARYTYIPMDQVWIDDGAQWIELAPYIVHEIAEFHYMKLGSTYEQAHVKANALENRLRKVLLSGVPSPSLGRILHVSERYLRHFAGVSSCACGR